MSSASGDEAELALVEPGKKGIPSISPIDCQAVAEAIVRTQRRTLVNAQPTRPPFRSGVLCVERYKYISFTLSVRRTRSGRARKTTVVAKKSPVKKLLARATRSPRKIHEIEESEVKTSQKFSQPVAPASISVIACLLKFSYL